MIREITATIMVVFASIFFYISAQGMINPLTTEYSVDSDWDEHGSLQNLNTDSNILYPSANEEGTWTSNIQQIDNLNHIELEMVSDPRNGNINYKINLWNETDLENDFGSPDKVVENTVFSPDYVNTYDLEGEYDFMEFEIVLEETEGNENQKPSVNGFSMFLNGDNSLSILDLFLVLVVLVSVFIGWNLK